METSFNLIKALPVNVEANGVIIKAADYQVQHQAESLLAAAQFEAGNVLASAKANASIELKKGYQKGLALAKVESAERLVKTNIQVHQMMQSAEKDLINLVKICVEKLIGEIEDDEKIVRLIRSGLTSMHNNHQIKIIVSHEMEKTVKAALPDMVSQLPGLEFFEVVADAKMANDSYLLEGDSSIVKGSISKHLGKLNELVESALAEPSAPSHTV